MPVPPLVVRLKVPCERSRVVRVVLKHATGFEPVMSGVADRRLKPAWLRVRFGEETGEGSRTLKTSLENSDVAVYITPAWMEGGAGVEPTSEPFEAARFCSVKLTAPGEKVGVNGGNRTRVSGMASQCSEPSKLRPLKRGNRSGESRTHVCLLPKQVPRASRLRSEEFDAPRGSRTRSPLIKSQVLSLLSLRRGRER